MFYFFVFINDILKYIHDSCGVMVCCVAVFCFNLKYQQNNWVFVVVFAVKSTIILCFIGVGS